jgi:NADH-quinone oxidoreductase subunit C
VSGDLRNPDKPENDPEKGHHPARRPALGRARALAGEHRPADPTRPAVEVIDVRAGMFGVRGTGDTSGYGGLRRPVTLPGSTARPYGGWFDEVADSIEAKLPGADSEDGSAIEKVVVDRGEITFHIRRAHLPTVARLLRDDASLRFELLSGVSGVHYPGDVGRELHAVYHLLSMTHKRRIRLEVSAPTSTRTSRRWWPRTRPRTGTSARPTTSSGSSSTATRR